MFLSDYAAFLLLCLKGKKLQSDKLFLFYHKKAKK